MSHEIQNSLNKKEHRSTAFMPAEASHPLPLTVPSGQLWSGCLQTTWKMMKTILKESQSELWSNLFSIDKIMDLPLANSSLESHSSFLKRSALLFYPVRDKKKPPFKASVSQPQILITGIKKTTTLTQMHTSGCKCIMYYVTQVSCLPGDQRVLRKFFVNQCY